MKHILIAPMMLIFASQQVSAEGDSSQRAYLGVGLEAGARVGSIANNGPAQAAGIEPGDLIVRFDDKDITRPDDLLQAVDDAPIGKEVPVTVIRRGKAGTIMVKLGQRLALSGASLDAYRQKLAGMLQGLNALGASSKGWDQPELQKFSELLQQFDELKKTAPPDDGIAQRLWDQLDREFTMYKPVADRIERQREARQAQLAETEAKIKDQLGALYVDYMTLQVCGERFQQLGDVTVGFREFLKTKEEGLPRELTDKLWNATAESFQSFQSVEVALQRTGDAQLYADCEQAGREAIALIMPAAGKSLQEPAVRKKDF